MEGWCVYALSRLSRNYIYVGITENLIDRMERHQAGRERTTKPYRPFKLLHTECVADRKQARAREVFLKSGSGKEFLHHILDELGAPSR